MERTPDVSYLVYTTYEYSYVVPNSHFSPMSTVFESYNIMLPYVSFDNHIRGYSHCCVCSSSRLDCSGTAVNAQTDPPYVVGRCIPGYCSVLLLSLLALCHSGLDEEGRPVANSITINHTAGAAGAARSSAGPHKHTDSGSGPAADTFLEERGRKGEARQGKGRGSKERELEARRGKEATTLTARIYSRLSTQQVFLRGITTTK